MATFINSFRSEWLKTRHSAASNLIIFGSLLIPAIMLLAGLLQFVSFKTALASNHFWVSLLNNSWRFMTLLLLPLGIILVTSMMAQIEFRNNAWKQLHTTPQSATVIFASKFTLVMALLLFFFVLFNVGLLLVGIVPALLFSSINLPPEGIPWNVFADWTLRVIWLTMPIVALQFLLSLKFGNFMVPIGVGFALYASGQISMSWDKGYLHPYTYCPSVTLHNDIAMDSSVNTYIWATGYSLLFTAVSYLIFTQQKAKG